MAQVSYGTITITDITDIESIKNWYLATNASSGVTKSTSGWTDTVQQMTTNKQYLWNYEQILGTDNAEISSTQPVIIGHYGINGQNGTDGNSITSIDEYYQVTNSTTNPGSSGWQKNTLVTPTSTNKYLWNYQVINYSKTAAEGSYTDARIIGVYGDTGPQGPQGNPGTNGINTATVYLYQRATSAPSKPSDTLTYTFSTAALTPTSSLGSWKQNIGDLTGTNPIWVIAAVASSNGTSDTILSTEWSTQVKMAQNGTDGQPGAAGAAGLNQATVYIYKRGDSAGTISPATATYTFSNGNFTAPTNWSKTIPSTPAGKPCWVSTAVAIGNESTATLTWNTPSVLVEDGTDGISPTVTSTSTGVKIVDAAGNETYINNGSNGQSYYTYIRYATDSSGSNMSSSPTGKTYIGVYSGTASSAPTTANSYTWSKYVGDPGTPATQYYAFVKYATDANGSSMQDSPDSTHIYVGTYTGTNAFPAASAYKWSKYVGDPGTPATQYYAFIRYATSSTGANMTDTPTASTTYVGTYSGTKSSPTASDYKWSVYVGTDGISVTQVRELYYLTTGNAPSKPTAQTTIYDDDRVSAWTSIVPTYIANGNYYISLETTLSNSTKVWSDVVLDQALTDANYNAAMANSIAQSANENAQGAMSQSTETQYQTDLLKAQVKNYWWDLTGAHIASGILRSGQTEADDVDKNNSNTYGFNSLVGLGSLTFGYNSYKAVELDGGIPALKFYKPSTTVQGDLTATLNSDGLFLSEGGIESGEVGHSGFVYLSTKDYISNVTINGHQADNWRQIIGTNFGIDSDGQIYATDANIAGTIVANDGTIGGFTINSTSIYNGINSITPSENLQPGEREAGIYLGIDGFRNVGEIGSTTIHNGVLTTYGAHIEGEVIIGENTNSNIYTKNEVYNKTEVYNSAQIDNTINGLEENISKTAWTVWISVKNIDYINSTATLQAVVYHYGEKITEGYNCQWYKNDILMSGETDVELSINTDGQTPEDLNAFYTCIVYDGLNQSLASDSFDLKTAQEAGELKKYIIRESEQEGIKIYDTEAHANYAHINSDGMSVIKNNSLIAQFGDKIILGPQNSYHIEIGADENSQEPEVGFYGDSGKVAYINASQLYINRSVVVQEMLVGKEDGTNNNQWAWRYDKNDKSIYLKWLG